VSASSLTQLLQLVASPVAIAFMDAPPLGIPKVSSVEPAGCGYWRRASAGQVFFTVADDHRGCGVGAHTHNVPLSSVEQRELLSLMQKMVGLSYIKVEEVAHIPTLTTPLKVAVYAPLESAPVPADVVLVFGNAFQLMLLAEAAQSAGVSGTEATMGRPTCALLPQAISTARTAASFGCIGNRVYNDVPDSEAYFAIPGLHLNAIVQKLELIVRANRELKNFHQERTLAAR